MQVSRAKKLVLVPRNIGGTKYTGAHWLWPAGQQQKQPTTKYLLDLILGNLKRSWTGRLKENSNQHFTLTLTVTFQWN